ncbi:MAG: acyl-coenzyme A thioesterase PaaI-like protein [Kiritimatiellia bacterium]|jgi:acyl-coenzyme A thioesterase PaaI-like protein
MDPKQLLTTMIPFITTVGIRIDDVGLGKAVATLPSRSEVQNHLGTAHAGATYTLGETAAGAAALSVFGDLLPELFMALKAAKVQHSKALRGDVVATAQIEGDPRQIRADYDAAGKADFDVNVQTTVGGVPTGTNVYTWAVRAPR